MSERFFRYVRRERVAAWVEAGWMVISPPLQMKLFGREHVAEVVIVEWMKDEQPREPDNAELGKEADYGSAPTAA